MQVDYPYRCQLARSIDDCKKVMNFFNYFEMFYCDFGIDSNIKELFLMVFIIMCMIQLGCSVAYLSDQ